MRTESDRTKYGLEFSTSEPLAHALMLSETETESGASGTEHVEDVGVGEELLIARTALSRGDDTFSGFDVL